MKGTKAKQAGRGVTLLALAAALGAAVYLNWSFAQDTPQTIDVQTEDTAAVSAEAGDEEAQAVPLSGHVFITHHVVGRVI